MRALGWHSKSNQETLNEMVDTKVSSIPGLAQGSSITIQWHSNSRGRTIAPQKR